LFGFRLSDFELWHHPNPYSMTYILPLLMFVIFFACVAMCYAEGLWSNAIRLINVVTAGLLAVNFYEPLANWLDSMQPSYTYLWDYLSLWAVFAVCMVIFRELTSLISHVKVRFLKLVDRVGSAVLSVWIGWVMVCFTMMTLHTVPLQRNFLFDGFQPEERMLMGLAPDRVWLAFVQKESMGAFARSDERVFDPKAEFMLKYATRRTQLQEQVGKTDSLRVGP
jgi:uncharacterized membrane protein required for colicin V production